MRTTIPSAMLPYDPRLVALRDSLPGQVLVGTRGARYHVLERIGEGGQGWVFRGSWDEPGGYAVVVKVLRPDVATPESLARFEREAQVLRMLGQAAPPNPHVVRFFDHATARLPAAAGGETFALTFTVLEHVRGPTLEDVLARSRGVGLALDRVRRIGRQVALALEHVHAHKVVHRDLKPSNVLLALDAAGEVAKVTDFGLVKLVDVGLGRTTALAGATLGYAPPEQFERGNRRVSPRTDVFSFAAMLYEMLTGARAFPYSDGENPLVVVTRLLNGPRPSLSTTRAALARELSLRPELVELLNPILAKATAAEPHERHASIAAFWGAVEPVLRAASERTSPPAGVAAAPADAPTAVDLPTPPPEPARAQARGDRGDRGGAALDATARQAPALADDAGLARPAAWSWRLRTAPVRASALAAAAFDPGGDSAVAIGSDGMMVWDGRAAAVAAARWVRVPVAPELDVGLVRGLAWLRGGDLVAFGRRAFAARVVAGGGLETWTTADPERTFLGCHADASGTTVTFVGERAADRALRGGGQSNTIGTMAQFARGKLVQLADVPECARLWGVTRLRDGGLVACGDRGAIVRLQLGASEYVGSVCGGHLRAVVALETGGAITVGAGGHALSLSPRLEAQLEAVQTTRDLVALTLDPSGVAWAGSAQARLLRRTAGSWVRMSAELGLSSSVLAVWASARAVRAVCDDGAVVEGSVRE